MANAPPSDAPAASTVYVTPLAGSPSEVAMLVVTVPAEGVLDDLVEGRELGLPAEVFLEGGGVGDELGRVAGTAGLDADGDGLEGDALDHVDDFPDGVAAARAGVVREAGELAEGAEGLDVGSRDVNDVDAVADGGAVGRGAAVAKPDASPRQVIVESQPLD